MKNLLAFLTFSMLIFSCKGQQDGTLSTIGPKEFASKLKSSGAQLVDVRTPGEFEKGHLDQAVNVDWNGSDFEKTMANFDKSKPVFVYCMVGGRSRKAAEKLHEMGFAEVYDMKGGIVKWNAEGLSEPASGGMEKAEFDKITSSGDVLVSFHAVWCGPCKKMAPFMERLESDLNHKVKVVRLDADEHKTLTRELQVAEIPMLMLFRNGKLAWKHTGYVSESDLKKQLQ